MKPDHQKMQHRNIVLSVSISLLILIGLSCTAAVYLFNSNPPEYITSSNVSNAGEISNALVGINERTFLMLKPDAVQRGLVGTIIQRLEKKGFKLVAIKFIWPSKEQIEEHYESSINRDHFPSLLSFMTSGPVVPMVWEGLNAVKAARQVIGHSNPEESMPGTIRADYSICRLRSIIHGSETLEDANREIHLWFHENELVSWSPATIHYLYSI